MPVPESWFGVDPKLVGERIESAYTNAHEVKAGLVIHMKLFRGRYYVEAVTATHMLLSCGAWAIKASVRAPKSRWFALEEFHCYEGERKQMEYLLDDPKQLN